MLKRGVFGERVLDQLEAGFVPQGVKPLSQHYPNGVKVFPCGEFKIKKNFAAIDGLENGEWVLMRLMIGADRFRKICSVSYAAFSLPKDGTYRFDLSDLNIADSWFVDGGLYHPSHCGFDSI
ncbi:MAG: hypothetical protein AAFY02_12200 [Pseudomonadota bacterium]